jgi:hypothetical protein
VDYSLEIQTIPNDLEREATDTNFWNIHVTCEVTIFEPDTVFLTNNPTTHTSKYPGRIMVCNTHKQALGITADPRVFGTTKGTPNT